MQRMNLYKSVAALLIYMGSVFCTHAQELNLGFNASPIIGMPVLDMIGTPAYVVRPQTFSLNATAGLSLNVRMKDLCIETGANVSTCTISFRLGLDNYSYNNIGGSSSISGNARTKAHGYAFTVPVLLGYKLYHHDANTTYDVFGILGAAYQGYTLDAYAFEEHSTNRETSTYTFTNALNPYPEQGYKKAWFDIVAGFKINAILRKVGLVEYGLRYHYPLSNAGKYTVGTIVSNNQYGSVFGGDFYPRLSYFDFHFTYYLVNIEAGVGRKRYKYN
jgi:hypothetical protein